MVSLQEDHYRHIVLSQLENILTANLVDDELDVDLILCDLLEVQAWQMSSTWGKIKICAKKEASMHRDLVTTLYIRNISHNIVGILTMNQRAILTNLNLTESVKGSWCVCSCRCCPSFTSIKTLVTYQKSEELIYITAEAGNHSKLNLFQCMFNTAGVSSPPSGGGSQSSFRSQLY